MPWMLGEALEFNAETLQLSNGEEAIDLEPKQAALLHLFITHPGRVISKEEILAQVWSQRVVGDEVIYVAVAGLRQALGDSARSPRFIRTMSGRGYQWVGEASLQADQAAHSEEKTRDTEVKSSRTAQQSLGSRRYVYVVLMLIIFAMGYRGWRSLEQSAEDDRSGASNASQAVSIEALPPESVELFNQARYLLSQPASHYREAEMLLKEVISQHPDFDEAYLSLAAAKTARMFDDYPRVKAKRAAIARLLERVLELSPDHRLAHARMANVEFVLFRHFDKARHHYEMSLPNVEGHFFYSQFLLAMGEYEEARSQLQDYINAYPQGYSKESVAWVYTMGGDYQKALEEIEKLAPYANEHFYYHVSKQAVHELLGNHDLSFQSLKRVMADAGYQSKSLDEVQHRFEQQGLAGVYQWLLDDPRQLDIGQYHPPLSLARYAIGAGDNALALTYLTQAMQEDDYRLLWLGSDPKYLPLHGEPAFKAMLEQLGLKGS
ncbi:winged helix-turn-helix domain-containing protein [Thaumasiovibrio subtropicus]|uniref:winged helix-turn-helix domain-containing protein n=1 Tax=Thaumasiovibrio subtropicus TaxID=1891207 RepID=UPI00131D2A4B|nr:winged helix-turn-helix domain-containing protein [Thaumasiovibrio subtropicus]